MTRTIAKTFDNGATVEVIVTNPTEQLISHRVVVYNVYDKNGTFAVQLDTAFDASEIAQSL